MAFLDRLLLSIFRTFLKRRARAKSAVLVCTDKHRQLSAEGQGMFDYPAAEGQHKGRTDSEQCCQTFTAAAAQAFSRSAALCATPSVCRSGQRVQRPMQGRGMPLSSMSAAKPASQAGAMSSASSLTPEKHRDGPEVRSQPHSSLMFQMRPPPLVAWRPLPCHVLRLADSEARPWVWSGRCVLQAFEVNNHTSSGASPAALALSSPPRSAALSVVASRSVSLQDVGDVMSLQ